MFAPGVSYDESMELAVDHQAHMRVSLANGAAARQGWYQIHAAFVRGIRKLWNTALMMLLVVRASDTTNATMADSTLPVPARRDAEGNTTNLRSSVIDVPCSRMQCRVMESWAGRRPSSKDSRVLIELAYRACRQSC